MVNIYFKEISLHKYTSLARNQGGVKIMSIIDLMLITRDILQYVQDVKTVRRIGWLKGVRK